MAVVHTTASGVHRTLGGVRSQSQNNPFSGPVAAAPCLKKASSHSPMLRGSKCDDDDDDEVV